MLDMATAAQIFDRAAVSLGVSCAVVAQVAVDAAPDLSHGAIYLGAASVIAAAGPHLLAVVNRVFDDRKHARETNFLDVLNQLKRDAARLEHLEVIAETAEELKSVARETEARYVESQARIAWLEDYVATLTPAVAENQQDIQALAKSWTSGEAPPLKAVIDPAHLPDPSARSGDRIPALRVPGSNDALHPRSGA